MTAYRLRISYRIYTAVFACAYAGIAGYLLVGSVSRRDVLQGVLLVAMLSVALPFLTWALVMMPTRIDIDEAGVHFVGRGRDVFVAWMDLKAVRCRRFGYNDRGWLRWISSHGTIWTSTAFDRLPELLREVAMRAPTAELP